MQTAGTLRGTGASSLLILLVPFIGYAHSAPLQYLPSIPGYIPVYIRYGDEPLEDINPELAEAFRETSNSAKSLQLDRTLSRVSNSFNDNGIDALLKSLKEFEESEGEHAYPLRVRATESRSFTTADNGNENKPKLLTIYQLPDDNDARPYRRSHGRSRTKDENRSAPPVFKVGPLTDTEREDLKKLAFEFEDEVTQPKHLTCGIVHNHRSKYQQGRRTIDTGRQLVTPIKLQNPLDETSPELPEISQFVADKLSRSSDDYDHLAPKTDKEPFIMKQRPAAVLSDVDKMMSIDLLDENKTAENAVFELGTGNKKLPLREQLPAAILANVDKISPVDLPDGSGINRNKKTEPNDEVAME